MSNTDRDEIKDAPCAFCGKPVDLDDDRLRDDRRRPACGVECQYALNAGRPTLEEIRETTALLPGESDLDRARRQNARTFAPAEGESAGEAIANEAEDRRWEREEGPWPTTEDDGS